MPLGSCKGLMDKSHKVLGRCLTHKKQLFVLLCYYGYYEYDWYENKNYPKVKYVGKANFLTNVT